MPLICVVLTLGCAAAGDMLVRMVASLSSPVAEMSAVLSAGAEMVA